MSGLKHKDLKPCALCNQGVMHGNGIMFYQVTIQPYVVDLRAVQRAAGMEMMMGGHAALANILGPDEDLAKQPFQAKPQVVCIECSMESSALPRLLETEEPPA